MRPEDMAGSGSGASYPNQMRDMSYLDQNWITPESAQFMSNSNPYGSTLNPNTSLPTPISLANTGYIDPHSPAVSNQSQDYQYHQYVDPMSHHGLGITTPALAQPVTASFDQHHHHHHQQHEPMLHNPFSTPPEQHRQRRTKRGESTTPRRRSTPVSIAPNPAGIQQLEAERRIEQEMEASHSNSSGRRKSSSTKRRFSQLAAETEFVKELREQNVPWKEVVERFEAKFGIECTQARLQMRNTRLLKRMKEWAEDDIRALRNAHEYWEKAKFEIISEKMQEFGASDKFSPLQCEQKWRELHYTPTIEDDDSSSRPPPRKRARQAPP
ncbi:hypothetical protein FQN54_005028 [Arachnomyces sp. PD_36]|nr:hypothetical protein FQN54_005028 [Arachnomyces sp. PD_36]